MFGTQPVYVWPLMGYSIMGYCNFVGYVVRNCGILKHLGVGDGWYMEDNPTGTYEPGFVHDFRSWDDLPSRYKYTNGTENQKSLIYRMVFLY